mgnify:CR=1 FL=1
MPIGEKQSHYPHKYNSKSKSFPNARKQKSKTRKKSWRIANLKRRRNVKRFTRRSVKISKRTAVQHF